MIDFARKPGRQQAVKLNFFEVILRRLCYLLAQKGNPDVYLNEMRVLRQAG